MNCLGVVKFLESKTHIGLKIDYIWMTLTKSEEKIWAEKFNRDPKIVGTFVPKYFMQNIYRWSQKQQFIFIQKLRRYNQICEVHILKRKKLSSGFDFKVR